MTEPLRVFVAASSEGKNSAIKLQSLLQAEPSTAPVVDLWKLELPTKCLIGEPSVRVIPHGAVDKLNAERVPEHLVVDEAHRFVGSIRTGDSRAGTIWNGKDCCAVLRPLSNCTPYVSQGFARLNTQS